LRARPFPYTLLLRGSTFFAQTTGTKGNARRFSTEGRASIAPQRPNEPRTKRNETTRRTDNGADRPLRAETI
jgi:hypothetical protein